METLTLSPNIFVEENLSDLSQEVDNFKPYVIKNVLLLSPGKWNGKNFSADSIRNGFNKTNWEDKKNFELIYSHDEKAENWVGNVINRNLSEDGTLYGDLEIYDKDLAIKLGKGKAKLGISAKVLGSYDRFTENFMIEQFRNFSVVYDPACKNAFINLSEGNEVIENLEGEITSSTSSGEPVSSNTNRKIDYGKKEKLEDSKEFFKELGMLLDDEIKAPGEYEKFKPKLEDEEDRKQIDMIISQEKNHQEILRKIKAKYSKSEGELFEENNVDIEKSKKEENMSNKMEKNEVTGTSDSSEELNSKIDSILDTVLKLSARVEFLESQKTPENPVQKIIDGSGPNMDEKEDEDEKEEDKEDEEEESCKETATTSDKAEMSESTELSEIKKEDLSDVEKLQLARKEVPNSKTVLLSKESLGKGAKGFTELEMNLLNALSVNIK